MIDVAAVCRKAKEASYVLAGYSAENKNRMLNAVAAALGDARNRERMKRENAVDVEGARAAGRDATFIDRLTLTDARIDDMIEGVRQIVALPDPVGEVVEHRTLDNGLDIKRVRAPLGSSESFTKRAPTSRWTRRHSVSSRATPLCFAAARTQ